ncbi:MAG TPA: hypothetical protein VNC16_03565 [Solirubrobacterales bacterium]|nr:hypothetical protein [Solirubrobacterales bacterium]
MIKTRFVAFVLALAALMGLQVTAAVAKPVLNWSPPQGIASGSQHSFAGAGDISCAGASLCVAVGAKGRFLYSTDPTGGIEAWTEAQVSAPEPADLTAVSCPATDFCAAVDTAGNVFLSQEPEQGAWTEIAIDDEYALTEIACSSATFCVAGDAGGNVFVSDEPTVAGAWEGTEIEAGEEVLAISCPSSSLCVAATDEDLFTSPDPAAGSWSATGLFGVWDVSCPSTSFCAATTFHGVVVSDEPEGGAATWVDSPGSTTFGALLACPTTAFCATAAFNTRIATSDAPDGSDPEWDEVALRAPADLAGFSCPSSDFCAAVLQSGAVLTSTEPAGGAMAWSYTATDGNTNLRSVDCPAPDLCLVAGPRGTLYTSTEPTVPGSWTAAQITDGELEQVECKTPEWCFARAYNRTLLYSEDPTGGPAAWNSVSMPFALDAACPEFFFCAAVNGSDEVLLSHEPLAGAGTWSATDMELPDWRLGPNELREVSCPFWGLCAVGGDVGTVLTSSSPQDDKDAWFKSFAGNPADFNNGAGPSIDGLDCPAWWFCAAAMGSGTISTTLDPPNPPVPWSYESTDAPLLKAISCSYEGGLCVAVSDWGWAVSAVDGTSGDPTWSGKELFDHEGLEEVSCAPKDAFCLIVDDEGYGWIGTVGDVGTGTGPAEVVMPPGTPAPGNPPRPRHCKARKAKGVRAGKIGIGGAIPLSNGGKRSKSRCARPL